MKTTFLRSAQGLLAVASFFLLTAAKGSGCQQFPVYPIEPVDPPPVACPIGSHLETICDKPAFPAEDDGDIAVGEPSPGSCQDSCVPDNACGPGEVEEWTCEDFASCSALDCPPPPESMCSMTCVPAACPPGTVEEWTCAVSEDEPVCDGPGCGDQPVSPPDCQLTCAPIGCPPGMHEELSCGQSEPSDPGDPDAPEILPGDCAPICVFDCPEGTEPIEVCEDGGDEAICSIVCEAIEPKPEQ